MKGELGQGRGLVGRIVADVFIFLVRVYQWTLSPLKNAIFGAGAACRFRPTCSHYAIECLRTLPLVKALRLATWRILRCNPWGGQGWDPVPKMVYREGPDGKPVKSLRDML
ncbi:membrane protein insertion efficiency factor YidD [Pelagicoccus sp. NFK12]|uniref:Putative membrane protein insertion efficiency factor n=1 Tax=Pelagicoccus enzymogenes TaxID=2773457 RepID=A0A927IGY5_9BACT|nr:membrane protein insertion efficiency factor YidD [Pelagicoccus enzymogenes]MBD5781677.1 membrane protein insertion efficiency factor YidD [Pelagicoccus enzymogenes]